MESSNTRKIEAVMICTPQDWYCKQFREHCDKDEVSSSRLKWHQVSPDEVGPEDLQNAEIVACEKFKLNWVLHAEHLRWIQFIGAGVDASLSPELIHSDIILTNASGVHEIPISEHVLGMMLMFTRGLHRCVRQQVNHEWNARHFGRQVSELNGATCGIIGLGSIGESVAQKAKAFGMRVVATRRHPERSSQYVDVMLGTNKLNNLLKESDFVVVCAPLTSETQGMIGDKEFEKMKSNAILINIARGAIVQQNALIRALQNSEIRGAGLDVTEPEPLQKDSPLWDMPNVIISPHVSGLNSQYGIRAAEIFLKNLHTYLADNKSDMINVVDRELGY